MKNKSTLGSDFEKFIRNALQKTDDSPDENTWANIAARQNSRNFWLRFRHNSIRFAPIVVALVLAVAGWKYFVSNSQAPTNMEPEIQQQTTPSQQPQVNVSEPSPDVVFSENLKEKEFQGKTLAAHLRSNIPVTSVRFLAEEGLRYENPATGTSVFIPANALISKEGNAVRGEVEFQLREYRSMADFMGSGIPMHYADERGSFFFNSGGMFDLRVKQDGDQLQMAAGQACDVRFTSTHKLTQPSLYYFDETDCAWKYQPDPAFTTSELPPVVATPTVVRDNRGLQVACLPNEYISPYGLIQSKPSYTDPTIWIQDGVATGYDYAFGKITMPGWFRKHPDWSNEQLLGGLERSVIQMKRHKDADDMFFPEDVNNVFTELKAFKDCYFVVNDGLGGKKSFSKEDLDSYWERVSVVQENGALCYVSFFGKQGLLQFYATLVGSTGNANFNADKVMAEYIRLRNERQQNFEQQANAWRRFLVTAQMFQEPEEWCMDATAWFDCFDKNLPLMRKRYAALKEQGIADNKETALQTWKNWEKRLRDIAFDNYTNKRSLDRNMMRAEGLTYALQVSRFGLLNCDQIFILRDDEVYVLAAYKTSDGRRIVPKYVNVMERKRRLCFGMMKAEKLLYAPGHKLDVVVTGTDGRFYYLTADAYEKANLKGQKSHTFTVEDVTEKTRTPRDWAELLEI